MDAPTLSVLIAHRLTAERERLHAQFSSPAWTHTGHFVVDDLLPVEIASEIHDAFPDHRTFRRLSSFRERKSTSKNLDALPSILSEITFAFQDSAVVEAVEHITGLRQQLPDPQLYAGGLSIMVRGDFLNPHIDNSHDQDQRNYRTLNLLYYVSPEWSSENGGNFELWDDRVKKPLEIVSRFNRLLVMETGPRSWHSVNAVRADRPRCCVSNYYFSSAQGRDYSHVTTFSARPEQKMRRLVAAADSMLRTALRRLVRSGVGRRDVYTG